MDAFSILTGVGTIYIAPVGTAFPAVDAAPASPWRSLGDTQDGVEADISDKVERITTDQRTGNVKAVRTEEVMKLKTKLAEATLENLADSMGVTLLDTPADVGSIGTREIPLYRGGVVGEYAFLFRGSSPYGAYSAQFQVPRGFVDVDAALKYEKGKNVAIPVIFEALEDPNASTPGDRFGKLIAQDAAALPEP